MENNYAIIMAGGVGSRFWPMSTEQKPKQFLDVLGTGKSLIRMTLDRLLHTCPIQQIYVVTNNSYQELVAEELPDLPIENILTEPVRRNTAPCVAYGCYKIYNENSNAKILVAPSDHLITNEIKFTEVIKACFEAAEKDILITLGIQPNRPETGYGYIQSTQKALEGFPAFEKVKNFTEKPDKDLAKVFLKSGDFYWNSGMFIWSAKAIVNAFKENMEEIHQLFKKGFGIYGTQDEVSFVEQAYLKSPNISVDYAILEKANNIYVYPCDIGWTDLGTWGSLYTNTRKDEQSNAVLGENVKLFDCEDTLVKNPNKQLIVAQGLKDVIVVNTKDILLICNKSDEQEIKSMVKSLSQDKNLKKFI